MKFWTFSGINSPLDENIGEHVDYVWPRIAPDMAGFSPDKQFASQLGTSGLYPPERNVISLQSEEMLDDEARGLAQQKITPGQFAGKKIKVMLVAPKTTSLSPQSASLLVEIYWNPNDYVPNQSIIRPDSLTFWRQFVRGGGKVWPVENRLGQGLGYGHDFEGFVVDSPTILRRVKIENPGSRINRYRWIATNQTAPSPVGTLKTWLQDSSNDFVLLGHSQGCNMIMYFLLRGLS